jgi:ATP-dependent Clp protease ATP-binding subunit ClpA
MLEEVISRLASRDIVLSVEDEVRSFLLDKGYQPKLGARPLRRTIQTYIEDRLADFLLGKGTTRGESIEAFLDGDEVNFRSGAGRKTDLAETVSK